MNTRILILCLVCLCHLTVYSQVENFKLYNLSREDGLPSESVQQIFQDSYGFLWIASFDGLFRWDGSSYKRYYTSETDEHSISNNVVYVVFEDYKKRIWIGTLSGLDMYQRELDRFERCAFDVEHSKIAVNAIVEDSKHGLWIGASSGLFRFDYDRRTSEKHNAKGRGMSDHVVFGMDIDSRDNLWIGTFHGGVNKFSIARQEFTHFRHGDDAHSISSDMINEIMVDHRDQVWVGSYDRGISVISSSGAVVKQYVTNPPGKIQNIISTIFEDSDHRVWVGAIREPLYYLDPRQDKLVKLPNGPIKKPNVSCESVTHIREDSFGNIWFGTQTEGLFYTNKSKNRFEYFANDDKKSVGLQGKIITSFAETADSAIWIGTSAGLTRYTSDDKQFKTYAVRDGLPSKDVHAVCVGDKNTLWIATWNGGISRFNLRTGRFINFAHVPGDVHSLNYNNVKTLLPEDTLVWVGTHGEGLAALDVRTGKFIHRGNNTIFPFDMGEPAWINHLMRDSRHRLWISTYNGLFMFDRARLHHYSHGSDSAVSGNAINMTLEDAHGNIWALNEKGGVDRLNERGTTFVKKFQANRGSKAFVMDARDKLWISSNDGIESIALADGVNRKFDASDGVVNSSFFNKAAFRTRGGKLLFGSTYGFNCFHPDSVRATQYTVTPYLTSFYIYDSLICPGSRDAVLHKVLHFTDTVALNYKQTFFTIGFTATNLLLGNKTAFSYKLDGLHSQWVDTRGERKASFTNLDYGTYTFRLRYTDASGKWVEADKTITILVNPPWWMTTWFRFLLLALIISGTILIFYLRLHRIRRHARFLETEVEKRTRELKTANEYLTCQNEEINRQSEEILRQQEQIMEQNQELEKSIAEATKLNRIKDRFFSILAHDLKNPIYTLTSISERLKQSIRSADRREAEQQINTLQRSSVSVYNLLNNLLHWGATHTNSLQNVPVDFSVAEMVRNNAQLLETELQQKDITLTILINTNHRVYADYNMVDTVIRNLLTNSVKFTYPKGEVVVESVELDEEIFIKVTDNGIGMTQDQIENIFHIGKQDLALGTAGETGTGLGLIISREFIEANRGSLHLTSDPRKGSTFSIRLPRSKATRREAVEVRTLAMQAAERSTDLEEVPVKDLMRVRGKKVLLVEDNVELRMQLHRYLSPVFEIFEAPHGKAGLDMALEHQPAFIISDVSMPVMDGIEFCQTVKRHAALSHIPFVLLTSSSSDESQFTGYHAGADVYLTKPIKKRILFQVILNFLDNQEKIRQRILNSNGFLSDEPAANKSDLEFLDKVIHVIEMNIEDPGLDFKIITESLAMSRTVVYNKLKAVTGLGIQEFIKSIRLKKSLTLLSDGKLAINEVAQRVGFSSQSYFNKCFLKQFDQTPKAYMNKTRKMVN